MSNTTPEDPASAPDASTPDADTGIVNPPAGPVSARGHVNTGADAEASDAAAEKATSSATPAPATTTAAPAPAIEPEPVVASDEDVAAAVARSNAGEATPAAAAGSATVDTASPAESAAPVTIAADQAAHPVEQGAASTVAAPAATTGEATAAPLYAPQPQPQPVAPIYVQRPLPPKKKSNRGVGILLALVGTVVFALLWGAVVALLELILTPGHEFIDLFLRFLGSWSFSGPVVVFFVGMVLLIQVLNRSRWWAYILGGLVVAALVYASYVGSALLDQDYTHLTADEAATFLSRQWVNPFAILAGIVAREVSVWTGAWLSGRGRRLRARNAEAQADYDQQLADAQNQAVAAYASPQQGSY